MMVIFLCCQHHWSFETMAPLHVATIILFLEVGINWSLTYISSQTGSGYGGGAPTPSGGNVGYGSTAPPPTNQPSVGYTTNQPPPQNIPAGPAMGKMEEILNQPLGGGRGIGLEY